MYRQPRDDVELFRRSVEHGIKMANVDSYQFIERYELDDFFEGDAETCSSPREIVLAFLCRYVGMTWEPHVKVKCVAVVDFLAHKCGRNYIDEQDAEAIRSLVEIHQLERREYENWLRGHFPDVR